MTYEFAVDVGSKAKAIERDAHSLFADRRAAGEWFNIPVMDAIFAIGRLAERPCGHVPFRSLCVFARPKRKTAITTR